MEVYESSETRSSARIQAIIGLAKVLPLTVADEKATEMPMVTNIKFIGMEPVPFGTGGSKMLDKAQVE